MTHISKTVYYQCQNPQCGEDYTEFDWQRNDFRCPQCNCDECEEGYNCEDCGRFITEDDIIDGWHIDCAKKMYNEELAVKYITWSAKNTISCAYDYYNQDIAVEKMYEYMTKNNMTYQEFAFDEMELWITFLSEMEMKPAAIVA